MQVKLLASVSIVLLTQIACVQSQKTTNPKVAKSGDATVQKSAAKTDDSGGDSQIPTVDCTADGKDIYTYPERIQSVVAFDFYDTLDYHVVESFESALPSPTPTEIKNPDLYADGTLIMSNQVHGEMMAVFNEQMKLDSDSKITLDRIKAYNKAATDLSTTEDDAFEKLLAQRCSQLVPSRAADAPRIRQGQVYDSWAEWKAAYKCLGTLQYRISPPSALQLEFQAILASVPKVKMYDVCEPGGEIAKESDSSSPSSSSAAD